MVGETRKPWPIWALLPLAVLGPPVLGIAMVWATPYAYDEKGKHRVQLFPCVAVALIACAATKAPPGAWRVGFVLLGVLTTCVSILFCSSGRW